jgi:hypothetical protein
MRSHINLIIRIADVACSQVDAYTSCLQSIPCMANDTLYSNLIKKRREASSMGYLCTPEARQGLQLDAFSFSWSIKLQRHINVRGAMGLMWFTCKVVVNFLFDDSQLKKNVELIGLGNYGIHWPITGCKQSLVVNDRPRIFLCWL